MSFEPEKAYVWVWLPGAEDPVVAGVLEPVGPIFNFTYAQSYLKREEPFPLYLPELPLERGPPAFDICPQSRAGGETSQAMAIGPDGYRMSQVAGCVARAATYRLNEGEAREIVDRQIDVIANQWVEVCDLAEMSKVDRAGFWRRQFLNEYALQGYR